MLLVTTESERCFQALGQPVSSSSTGIDIFYKEQESQIFQLVRAARTAGASDAIEHELSEEAKPLTLLELWLAFDEEFNSCPRDNVKELIIKECTMLCEDMEARLKTRRAGLLEVQGYQRAFRKRTNPTVHKWNGRVQYLHRTDRGFLDAPEEWEVIVSRTSGTEFDRHIALLRSYVLHLGFPGLSEHEIPHIITLAMMHAHTYQTSSLH
jgi:hypothetical protein